MSALTTRLMAAPIARPIREVRVTDRESMSRPPDFVCRNASHTAWIYVVFTGAGRKPSHLGFVKARTRCSPSFGGAMWLNGLTVPITLETCLHYLVPCAALVRSSEARSSISGVGAALPISEWGRMIVIAMALCDVLLSASTSFRFFRMPSWMLWLSIDAREMYGIDAIGCG